jgi:hypothetical protein
MLKKLEEKYFDLYVDFAYNLALDLTKSGYPTYADGVKTKDDFVKAARFAFSNENDEILLYEQNGEVLGWIHYYVLQEDRYVGTCSFCIAEGMRDAINEFAAFAKAHFPGNDLYLGFSTKNTEAVAALRALGFECIEDSFHNVVFPETYEARDEHKNIVPITRENYALFASLHAQDEDMYWNTERIRNAIDRWKIFAFLREGKAVGAVYFLRYSEEMDEIFGIDFDNGMYDREVCKALLYAALNEEKRDGAKSLIFFSEKETQADALSCGFHCIDEYMCFRSKL